jgi:adenylate cyclase class 2
MQRLETEIKFYLPDRDTIRRQILKWGAQTRGRVFETNFRYEDEHRSLLKRRSLLRLRRNRNAILTFKSPPPEDSAEFKVLSELEVRVSDFETMHMILKQLGFHREQIYEKWRETLDLDQVQFCLDQMPYGNFLEIEGPPRDIKRFAAQLGLPWEHRIRINYLQIFNLLKDRLNLDFTDVTFDNFADIEVNLTHYLDQLVAQGVNERRGGSV